MNLRRMIAFGATMIRKFKIAVDTHQMRIVRLVPVDLCPVDTVRDYFYLRKRC